jgi:hypothetical protein
VGLAMISAAQYLSDSKARPPADTDGLVAGT